MSPIKIPRLDSKLWARSISNCLKEKRKKEKSCPSVGSHPYLKVLFKTSYSILSLSQHPWLPTCWFNPQSPAPLLKLSKANPSPLPPTREKVLYHKVIQACLSQSPTVLGTVLCPRLSSSMTTVAPSSTA